MLRSMWKKLVVTVSCSLLFSFATAAQMVPVAPLVQKAEARSSLARGKDSFHLRAVLTKSSRYPKVGPTDAGSIEIWWADSRNYAELVHTPELDRRIVVQNGVVEDSASAEFVPLWVQEMQTALVDPVPDSEVLEKRGLETSMRASFDHTRRASFTIQGSDGSISKTIGAGLTLEEDSGLVRDYFTEGFGGEFSEYNSFHSLKVARHVTIEDGTWDIEARVALLEDLSKSFHLEEVPSVKGTKGNRSTKIVPELEARKLLMTPVSFAWPPLPAGSLQGVMVMELVVDRTGTVHETRSFVSDNPGLEDAALEQVLKLKFQPYVVEGHATQMLTTWTLPFKAEKLLKSGEENFLSGDEYFRRSQRAVLRGVGGKPFHLHASGKADTDAVDVDYTEDWADAEHWRQEVNTAGQTVVESRNGQELYRSPNVADSPRVADIALRVMHYQLPSDKPGYFAGDWRVERAKLGTFEALRVTRGAADGAAATGTSSYYFDPVSLVLRAAVDIGPTVTWNGLGTFEGGTIAKQINAKADGESLLTLQVDIVEPLTQAVNFTLPGVSAVPAVPQSRGDNIQMPVLLHIGDRVPGVHGDVRVRCQVDEDGDVIRATVLDDGKISKETLDGAMKLVRSAKFKPGSNKEVSMSAAAIITVHMKK